MEVVLLIVLLIVLITITVLPVKWAASFVGAGKDSFGSCALAVIIGSVVAGVLFNIAGGSLPGLALAFLGVVITYKFILLTTIGGAFGLTVVALLLQIAVISAYGSLGYSIFGGT